jgi:hypothetical protein
MFESLTLGPASSGPRGKQESRRDAIRTKKYREAIL